ncbi:MAG TPA: hypothetical protein VGI78_16735 [Acetobacteraceae bacterium]
MKTRILGAALAAGALCGGSILNIAHAQVPPGTLYVFHSQPQGACPALDWHVIVGEGGQISGMISWDAMKSMAHVTGTMGADRNFKMTATEVTGGSKTATITGQAASDGWLTAEINGPGVACKGVKIPIYKPASGNG